MTSRILINHVKRAIGAVYGVSNVELDARDRHSRFVEPRQMAMAVAKHLTEQSSAQIGKAFQRDETTVIRAVRKVQDLTLSSTREYETFFEVCRLARDYAQGGTPSAKISRSADLDLIPNGKIREMDAQAVPVSIIAHRLGLPVTVVSGVLGDGR